MVDALTRWPSLSSSPWILLVSPVVILGGEPLDQRGDLGADRRPSHPVRVGPLAGDQAMPLLVRLQTNAGWSVSTLAATRRVGRRTWPAVRMEYFEAGRLRSRSASRRRLVPLSSLRRTFAASIDHELPDLRGCRRGLADDAASHVLEDLDEGDAVRVDPLPGGQPHDDPGQAVVHRQMRPYLLTDQLRVR